MLTRRYADAVGYACEAHAQQARKGTRVPYAAHVIGVSSLVLEAGGDEDLAIAALLHDAAEDQGGAAVLAEIKARFGPAVVAIVDECSDTVETPKPPWQQRKQSYIDHLDSASDDTILVSLADKLDNARAILRDVRGVGSALWERFSVNDPQQHLWYYRSLSKVYERRNHTWMVAELRRVLDQLEAQINASAQR
jgi:(p)ppGpp synthase/HD superfamily hydrolase